jgi:peptidoglycan hydrolase-like protein with peptidoglycan-binding domain
MVVLASVEEQEERAIDFGTDLVQRGALISRIQDVLAELGIYTGPSDGQFSAATERSIRIHESHVELAITGQPSRALLDHLQTVGRANKLLLRLEQTRDRNQETARNVLFASAVSARLRSDETRTANPLRDPAPCFAAPTPTCLLVETFESAKAIGDTRFRDWAMGDVAVARAAAGLTEDIYRTVGLIDDPRLIVAALRDAAVAWAEGGQIANACYMIDGMPEPMFAAEILAAIATGRAREGDAARVGQGLGELLVVANGEQNAPAKIALIADLAPKLHAANATDAAKAHSASSA